MLRDTLPELAQFLGCYFHQDFMEEFSSPDDAVRVFLAQWPPEGVSQAAKELDTLLQMDLDERRLDDVLVHDLACEYNPAADGMTSSEWLRQVLDKLRQGGTEGKRH